MDLSSNSLTLLASLLYYVHPLTFLFQMCLLVLKFLFGFSHSEYVSTAISYLFFITCIFSVISVSIVLIAALNPRLIILTSESSWNGLHVRYLLLHVGHIFPFLDM